MTQQLRSLHQWLLWRGAGWSGCDRWSRNWSRYYVTRCRR